MYESQTSSGPRGMWVVERSSHNLAHLILLKLFSYSLKFKNGHIVLNASSKLCLSLILLSTPSHPRLNGDNGSSKTWTAFQEN